ncbi:hypothetical protein Tco_0587649 [Tanacetum coccineum]
MVPYTPISAVGWSWDEESSFAMYPYIHYHPQSDLLSGIFYKVPLSDLHSAATILRVLQIDMSSASSAMTYTSVYTDSYLGKVFWGADEEPSDGGPPRVDGLFMQLVAPPSPDYVPGALITSRLSPYVPDLEHSTSP